MHPRNVATVAVVAALAVLWGIRGHVEAGWRWGIPVAVVGLSVLLMLGVLLW